MAARVLSVGFALALGLTAIVLSPAAVHATTPVCTGAKIVAYPTTVAHASSGGTQVLATASATSCTNGPRYEYWLRAASSPNWVFMEEYQTSRYFVWDSTGADPGVVYLGVHIRDLNSTADYDTVASTAVIVTASTCSGVTISASPASVVHSSSGGAHVTVTAAASGCTTSPLYEFWLRPASSSTWQMVRAYSSTATYDWNTTGAAVGTVYLGVHVKDASSPNAYDAVASTPVSVT